MAPANAKVNNTYIAETKLLIRENKNEFLRLMSELSMLDRDILVMKFFLDMTNEEIANNIGATKATVDNRIYHGEKKLQTHSTEEN